MLDAHATGEPEFPVQIESIEVFPDPPEPGKNLTVTVRAIVLEEIEVRLAALALQIHI